MPQKTDLLGIINKIILAGKNFAIFILKHLFEHFPLNFVPFYEKLL
jgi:hypothetical protein